MSSKRRWLGIVGSSIVCLGLVGCGGVEEVGPSEPEELSEEVKQAKERGMQQYMENMDKYMRKGKKK